VGSGVGVAGLVGGEVSCMVGVGEGVALRVGVGVGNTIVAPPVFGAGVAPTNAIASTPINPRR
jgi:hypothetical protein